GVAEGEDAAVRRDHPVALAGRRGGHTDDGLIEVLGAHGAEERAAEDAAVEGDGPGPGGADDDGVQRIDGRAGGPESGGQLVVAGAAATTRGRDGDDVGLDRVVVMVAAVADPLPVPRLGTLAALGPPRIVPAVPGRIGFHPSVAGVGGAGDPAGVVTEVDR